MAPSVVAALVAAGVSLVLAAISIVASVQQNRRVPELERLKSDLVI